MSDWRALIAARDVKVNRIYKLQAEIRQIDEELEKNPPPEDVCVAVWVRKAKAKVAA